MSLQPTYQRLASYDHLIRGHANMRSEKRRVRDIPALAKMLAGMAAEATGDLAPLARHLRGASDLQTKYNIWHFTQDNLRYKLDDQDLLSGQKEQPRTPVRSWADRHKGVDCEDYSMFMAALLKANGLPAEFRIIKQNPRKGWSHIYVLSGPVVLDRLLPFNSEAPYQSKMEIEVLSGTDAAAPEDPRVTWLKMLDPHTRTAIATVMPYVAGFTESGTVVWKPGAPVTRIDEMLAQHTADFHAGRGLSGLGAFEEAQRRRDNKPDQPRRGAGHTIMKVMPIMIIGRNSFLLMLRTNVFGLARKLRLMYLTEDKAKAAKLNLTEWRKLRDRKEKIEKTYYNLGGEVRAFKEAIAKGAHVDVNRLGVIDPATAAIAASAAPVLIGITAAIAGIDFKSMSKDSADPSVGLDTESITQATKGLIKKLKDKVEDRKLLESIQDAVATDGTPNLPATDDGGGSPPPPPGRDDTADKKPVWPWVLGGVLLLGGGAAWYFSTQQGPKPKK